MIMCGVMEKNTKKKEVMKMIDIIIIFALFAWMIFTIAAWRGNTMIGFMAGAMILVIGIFSFIYGVGGDNNDLTRAFGYVHLGVGLIVCLTAGLEEIQSWGADED
jgi:hypothetical protein